MRKLDLEVPYVSYFHERHCQSSVEPTPPPSLKIVPAPLVVSGAKCSCTCCRFFSVILVHLASSVMTLLAADSYRRPTTKATEALVTH